jgi:RHS repeat-associated protein
MTSNYPLWIRGCPLAEGDEYAYATAEEDGGSVVCCVSKFHRKEMEYYLDPDTIHSGLTNASGEISAQTNLKNTHFKLHGHWRDSKEFGEILRTSWKSFLSDGGERVYFSSENYEDAMNIQGETKPDTTKLSFDYYSDKHRVGFLKEIKACNHSHQHTFGWLKVDYNKSHKNVAVRSSTGKEVQYSYEDYHHGDKLGNVTYLEKVQSTDRPTEYYSYDTFHGHRYLSKISYPDGRYLKLDYDSKGRVTEQRAPVGPDGKEKRIFCFVYYPDRKTEVYDAEGRKTLYRYSSRDRLTHIEKFKNVTPKSASISDEAPECADDEELDFESPTDLDQPILPTDFDQPIAKGTPRKLYRGEEFFWGKRESTHRGKRDDSDEGHLLAKTIYNKDEKAVVCERYSYDSYGNITEETLHGNLSGQYADPFSVSDEGSPKHHTEKYSKQYTYSHDKFHLKTSQKEDDGPKIEYEYQPGTNLLTAKFTYDGHKLKIREFFEYDSDAVLVKKIIDNGSSTHASHLSDVTERRITYIKPVRDRDDYGVGLPERITECYLNIASGKEVQLKRIDYSYTKAGLVEKEEAYDADDHYKYKLYTKYDSKNRPTWKTDAIGREYRFEYDDNGNKTREELVDSGVFTALSYDKANRLVRKSEHHSDGVKFVTSYSYDAIGNLISETDHYGQTTTYSYDSMNRERQAILPSVLDKNGTSITPTLFKKHDLLDNVSSQTDANGNTFRTTYTIRHEPCCIEYPDGSSERFEYNLNGTLAKKWERNGSKKKFTYDFLGRVLTTKILDANGTLLSTTSNTYDAFHCTSSTDPMGYTTYFTYDGAGRLSSVQKAQSLTLYYYDSLGRKKKTTEVLGQNQYIDTIEERDILDRVIESKRVYSDGTLLSLKTFEYDARGNCTDVTSYTSADDSTTTHTDYSSRNVPVRIIDALGNKTKISYDYEWKNDLNQNVLRKVTKDPLGNQTIEIFDTHSRLDTVEKRASDSTLLAKTTFRYDAKGNKTQEKEYVVVNGSVIREYIVEWTYTPMDRVSSLIEQPGTSEEKVTRYTYTKGGLVETICKPDGVVLTHIYDGLNRLIDLSSSDGTIHFTYTYDLNNNPISVIDENANVPFRKSFDEFGHVTSEDLWPGLNTTYTYDPLGRCTNYGINNAPYVEYQYCNGHLTDVIRKDPSGTDQYRHRYTKVDLEEKVVESYLIASLGTSTQTFDAMGRVSTITTPFWQEVIPQDGYDAAGNLHKADVQDNLGGIPYRYSYDNLYQLIREEGLVYEDFTYDSICNRVKKNGTDCQVNALNELLSESAVTYNYDKNGNLIELLDGDKHLTFCYDALDRLRAVERPNKFRVEFFYDPSHRRLRKQEFTWVNNSWQQEYEKRFIYFGDREVGSCDSQGAIQEFRVLGRGKGAELGATVAVELDNRLFCPINDHRGNIVTLIDVVSLKPFETYRYAAFGEEQRYDSTGAPTDARNPWRFASKRTDPETRFVFFGRRYYSPYTGRFVTPDPVGFSDGPNLYAYVHNSPLVLIDPYGLTTLEDARDVGVEAGMGAVQGFIHPYDTLSSHAGYLVQFRRDVCNGDFSSITNTSVTDKVRFACARTGEAAGMAVGVASMAKVAFPVVRAGVYAVGAYAQSLVSGVGSWAAERGFIRAAEARMAVAAEAKAVAMGETAVASENSSGIATRIGAKRSSVAESSIQKKNLAEHLRQCEKYGSERVRFLENGRVRYYGPLDIAKKPGEMTGRRMVREWDPKNSLHKTWHETLDGNGRIRSVRPEYNDGLKRHFIFHEDGSYGGTR